MSHTLPSRSMPYKIFLEENGGCVLSIDWQNGKHSIYWLDENGEEIKSEQFKDDAYNPSNGQEEEYYYMDYLSGDTMRKIITLTTVYSCETIILAFDLYKGYFSCEDVQYKDFDMQHANMLSDYLDYIKQLYLFTGDEVYNSKYKESDEFLDRYFFCSFSGFQRDEWNDEDKISIKRFFEDAITFLRNTSSN